MRFIVSGGGTGGHIYPALAIARASGQVSRSRNPLCRDQGRNGGGDCPQEGLPFQGIPSAGLKRKLSLKNLGVVWQAGHGLWQAAGIIRRFRPGAVIGTGGYVCGPVVLAAALKESPL